MACGTLLRRQIQTQPNPRKDVAGAQGHDRDTRERQEPAVDCDEANCPAISLSSSTGERSRVTKKTRRSQTSRINGKR